MTTREAEAERSHRRQLARTGSKKRATEAVIQARTQASIQTTRERARQQRAATRLAAKSEIATIQAREAAHVMSNRQLLQQRSAARRRAPIETYIGHVPGRVADSVAGKAIATATPSSESNIVMVTIFTIAGLIVMYRLVTQGPALAGFLGTLGDWISLISTNATLFKVNTKGLTNG